ncbi:MAG: SMI1/KNR4 family protein [Nostoc sp.]|uniref:SMI1/KNR4 family protein n=1 Tax=Nostoc sp. TaxID=1180 RepID=UPI002FF5D4D6
MTGIKENLKRIWDCLVIKAPEITSLLQPGLKPEEIDEITKDLPFKLPEEVYEIYQWRNGLLKGVDLYGWKSRESFIDFNSLQATIQHLKKIIIAGQPIYFIIIFSLAHENGGDFFSVPIGREISFVIILYDDDDFLESVDY